MRYGNWHIINGNMGTPLPLTAYIQPHISTNPGTERNSCCGLWVIGASDKTSSRLHCAVNVGHVTAMWQSQGSNRD
jgi:hypothetical protein